MRAILISAAAGLAVFGLASPAGASPSIGHTYLNPSSARVGEAVKVQIVCSTNAPTGTAESTAFAGRISLQRGASGISNEGTATIRKDVKAGTYKVSARCSDGVSGSATLTVVADKGGEVYLSPTTVARGGTVKVGAGFGGCYGAKGGAVTGTARSDAFTAPVNLIMGDGGGGGRATIRKDAKLGKHTVTVTCVDGSTGSATLTVTSGARTPIGGVESGGGPAFPAGAAALAGLGVVTLGALIAVRRRRHAAQS